MVVNWNVGVFLVFSYEFFIIFFLYDFLLKEIFGSNMDLLSFIGWKRFVSGVDYIYQEFLMFEMQLQYVFGKCCDIDVVFVSQ